jgi:hypothetical protein
MYLQQSPLPKTKWGEGGGSDSRKPDSRREKQTRSAHSTQPVVARKGRTRKTCQGSQPQQAQGEPTTSEHPHWQTRGQRNTKHLPGLASPAGARRQDPPARRPHWQAPPAENKQHKHEPLPELASPSRRRARLHTSEARLAGRPRGNKRGTPPRTHTGSAGTMPTPPPPQRIN